MDDVSKPLLIDYDANVFQSSGEEWKNVKLKLSTANPSLSGKLPVMDTWYLGAAATALLSTDVTGEDEALKGMVRDNSTKEPIPFCNIILEQDGRQKMGCTSDMDGNYSFRPVSPGKYDLKASFVGYKPTLIRGVVIRSARIEFLDIAMEATSVELQSYEVLIIKFHLCPVTIHIQEQMLVLKKYSKCRPLRKFNSNDCWRGKHREWKYEGFQKWI